MTFPTFVARFKNRQITRMSCYCESLHKPDRARGIRLAHAAMDLRVAQHPELAEGSGEIAESWFEIEGKRLTEKPPEAPAAPEAPDMQATAESFRRRPFPGPGHAGEPHEPGPATTI